MLTMSAGAEVVVHPMELKAFLNAPAAAVTTGVARLQPDDAVDSYPTEAEGCSNLSLRVPGAARSIAGVVVGVPARVRIGIPPRDALPSIDKLL
jgi:hypothetical protein